MGQIFNRRRATRGHQAIPYGAVDLGLPSGLLWAQGNIVKDANGNYSIGNETDYGCYFSWGNIEGHNKVEGYVFSNEAYESTPGAQVDTNIASNDSAHDAALAHFGSPWHLPTKEDFQELYDNTDSEYTTIDNIYGQKFMKKTDHSVYVFFSAAGNIIRGTDYILVGKNGHYWSSSKRSAAGTAFKMNFNSSSVEPQNFTSRHNGVTIRAVCSPNT